MKKSVTVVMLLKQKKTEIEKQVKLHRAFGHRKVVNCLKNCKFNTQWHQQMARSMFMLVLANFAFYQKIKN